MKLVDSWLRDWVNPGVDATELGHELTMAGHEMDSIAVQGDGLEGVVVGHVADVATHPDADRLSVCQVDDGTGDVVTVVCGAPNVRAGMKSPFARPGIVLPNGTELKEAKIRGVTSCGMLCSAAELNLGDDADGIIELPDDAPSGEPLAAYLGLPDSVITLDLTPNRGDCFSVLGLARDISALTGAALRADDVPPVPATIDATHVVNVLCPEGCPTFAGRVIRGIDAGARSPLWLTERLRRAGLRPIHPVVDITNFVMLDLGQPLHAYDLALVQGPIGVRLGVAGDTVTLLDEKQATVTEDTLVITDDSGVIGLAGIMGGQSTAVSRRTTDVFFEAAFWPPEFMAGRARTYGLHTDASLRFERGVDPAGQARAIEHATALLLEIAGGDAGPTQVTEAAEHKRLQSNVQLRRRRLAALLGTEIADHTVEDILTRLGMSVTAVDDGWDVAVPSHRFDIELEVDLVEEVARIYGYDEIPETTANAETPLEILPEDRVPLDRVTDTLIARDYHEVITYSFIDPDLNQAFTGQPSELALSNPISTEMGVMRGSLWPGLVACVAANAARQQSRIRIFEIGKSFHGDLEHPVETMRIAAAVAGPALPEQWGEKSRDVDFFDIKGDVTAILTLAADPNDFTFAEVEHPALQPGQCAQILSNGRFIGVLGRLHPRLARRFDVRPNVSLLELDATEALLATAPRARPISRFPSIRRDIAIVVPESVAASDLVATVTEATSDLIENVRIFDVYTGPGIEAGRKSIALGLILQETSRTLTDADADNAMAAAMAALKNKFAAELRD